MIYVDIKIRNVSETKELNLKVGFHMKKYVHFGVAAKREYYVNIQRVIVYNTQWINHRRRRFNSSPPSATFMCQWIGSALVQIMACCLFGAKPLFKPTLGYCQLDHKGQTSGQFENTKLFIHENAFENIVCEMAAILSRGRWVKRRLSCNICKLILKYQFFWRHILIW